jgi:hypothetical protein
MIGIFLVRPYGSSTRTHWEALLALALRCLSIENTLPMN